MWVASPNQIQITFMNQVTVTVTATQPQRKNINDMKTFIPVPVPCLSLSLLPSIAANLQWWLEGLKMIHLAKHVPNNVVKHMLWSNNEHRSFHCERMILHCSWLHKAKQSIRTCHGLWNDFVNADWWNLSECAKEQTWKKLWNSDWWLLTHQMLSSAGTTS